MAFHLFAANIRKVNEYLAMKADGVKKLSRSRFSPANRARS
ncbi:MAG: hypothetical protein WCI12_11755 [Actinomycetes bacterium]